MKVFDPVSNLSDCGLPICSNCWVFSVIGSVGIKVFAKIMNKVCDSLDKETTPYPSFRVKYDILSGVAVVNSIAPGWQLFSKTGIRRQLGTGPSPYQRSVLALVKYFSSSEISRVEKIEALKKFGFLTFWVFCNKSGCIEATDPLMVSNRSW